MQGYKADRALRYFFCFTAESAIAGTGGSAAAKWQSDTQCLVPKSIVGGGYIRCSFRTKSEYLLGWRLTCLGHWTCQIGRTTVATTATATQTGENHSANHGPAFPAESGLSAEVVSIRFAAPQLSSAFNAK